jgi:hypothetical protein
MERKVGSIAPLVSELAHFCQLHEAGEGRGAVDGMLAHLRKDWADLPAVELPAVSGRDRDSEELALIIIGDVGEVAEILLARDDADRTLAWARPGALRGGGRGARLKKPRPSPGRAPSPVPAA